MVSAIGSLATGIMGSDAAKEASKQEAQVQQNALDYDKGIYNTATTNLSPYISTGTNALYSLSDLMGLGTGPNGQGSGALDAYKQYTQTPYYTFPLQQGEQSLDQSAASKGLALSGGQANALDQYAQNYASQNFGNYTNALSSLAGQGSSSAENLASAGNSAANNVNSSSSSLASALGLGTMGANNALSQGISGMINGLTANQNSGSGTSYSVLSSLASRV